MPLVSVCIPVYNTARFIEKTVDFFLGQTLKDIEIIVQDDASTDGTWELLLAKYSDHKAVRIFRNDTNLGIGANWNRCFEHAIGRYVVIANADDIYYPEFLQTGVDLLEKEKVGAVTFQYVRYFEGTHETVTNFAAFPTKSGLVPNSAEYIFFNNPFSIVFTVFKREELDVIKAGRGKLFLHTQICDFELMVQVALRNDIYFSSLIVGAYRFHDTNNSGRPLAELKSLYFDGLPQLSGMLRDRFHYKRRIRTDLRNYIVALIRFRAPLNFRLLFEMFRQS